MKKYSNDNHLEDSEGRRWNSAQIAREITKGKAIKISRHIDIWGYEFCEHEVDPSTPNNIAGMCGKNASSGYIDCSHEISVERCKNDPMIPLELAWDPDNIKLRCRKHHAEHDKTY